MSQKKKGDYLATPIQMLAYQLGLVSNPNPDKVRKMAYGSVAPNRNPPVPPKKKGLPDSRMKSDFQAAAATAFNTAVRANPKPKNPNEGLGKPLRGRGNPKIVNPYQATKAKIPARGEARGGMKSTLESYRASKVAKSSVSMAGGGVNKIDTAKNKMKRQQQGRKPDKKVTSISSSQQVSGKVTKMPEAKFKGNWTGAAPTEMQKRGGQKIMRPKGNLLDLIRRKK